MCRTADSGLADGLGGLHDDIGEENFAPTSRSGVILGVIAADAWSWSSAADVPPKKGKFMLEVIDKGSCSEAQPVPLLFVHRVLARGLVLGREFPGLLRRQGLPCGGFEPSQPWKKP
jgi:hypothetical protein